MRSALVALAVSGAFAAFVATASPAGAVVTGPCQGTIKGVDVAPLSDSDPSQAIKVAKDEVIQVGATSSAPIAGYKVQLGFAGINWTIGKGTANGTSWSKAVNVEDYARYGVGLYQVRGISSGAAQCTGAALVKVGGNPLSTPAGITGLALSVIGVGAVARTATKCWRGGPTNASQRLSVVDRGTDLGVVYSPCQGVRDYVETTRIICRLRPVQEVQQFLCGKGAPLVQRVCLWG